MQSFKLVYVIIKFGVCYHWDHYMQSFLLVHEIIEVGVRDH